MRQFLLSIAVVTLVAGCGAHPAGIAVANRAREIGSAPATQVGMNAATNTRNAKLVQVQRAFEVPAARKQAFESFVEAYFKQHNIKFKLSGAPASNAANAGFMLAVEGSSAAAINQAFGDMAATWQTQPAPAAQTAQAVR
jgi:hypothetical protein